MIRATAGHLAAGLAAAGHPGAGTPAGGRIALVAVAVLAVGAFTALQIRVRSGHRRRPDWRTPPSRYGLDAAQDEAPGGNEERYRPDWRYGYPPGHAPGSQERGPAS